MASDIDRWHAARKESLGATDAAVILGANPWKSQLELYSEKVGDLRETDLDDIERVQWGKRLEPVVIEAYAERAERKAEHANVMLRSKRTTWPAHCTLDGTTWLDDLSYSDRWPLEVKTAGAFGQDEWADGIPEMYRIQIHHQMLVTGAQKATLACLSGGQQLVWTDVDRDEDLVSRINAYCDRFWTRVLHREPPEPDHTDASRRALNALYPESIGATIELAAEWQDTFEHLGAIKDELKQLEAERRLLENKIKAELGVAEKGALANGWAVSWKTQQRKGYTVEPTSCRVLRIIKPKGK